MTIQNVLSSPEQVPFPGLRGLPEKSILYISLTIAPDHPLAPLFQHRIDNGPDADLGRILDSSGPWVKPYIRSQARAPELDSPDWHDHLRGVRGIIAGGSFHTWAKHRPLADWQRRTVDMLHHALVDRQIPFLGLCGGAQAANLALGGTVARNDAHVGLGPDFRGLVVRTEHLRLTPAGRQDPIFKGCQEPAKIIAIHSDHLEEIPKDATVLASARDLTYRVVAVGDRVRLFQPHPELSLTYAHRILKTLEPHISARPEDRARVRRAIRELAPAPQVNRRVVGNFLAMCADIEPL